MSIDKDNNSDERLHGFIPSALKSLSFLPSEGKQDDEDMFPLSPQNLGFGGCTSEQPDGAALNQHFLSEKCSQFERPSFGAQVLVPPQTIQPKDNIKKNISTSSFSALFCEPDQMPQRECPLFSDEEIGDNIDYMKDVFFRPDEDDRVLRNKGFTQHQVNNNGQMKAAPPLSPGRQTSPTIQEKSKPNTIIDEVESTKSQSEQGKQPERSLFTSGTSIDAIAAAQKYQATCNEMEPPKVVINDINDLKFQRKQLEEQNRKNYQKFQQALKVAESKNQSLHGMVFDRAQGRFVQPMKALDPKACSRAIDSAFLVQNGSVFTRMDAELEIFHTKLKDHVPLPARQRLSTLFCKESRCKTNVHDFIQPGSYSVTDSPIKFKPKKIQQSSVAAKVPLLSQNIQQSDLEIIGGHHKKEKSAVRLINPVELYASTNFIDLEGPPGGIPSYDIQDPCIIKTGTGGPAPKKGLDLKQSVCRSDLILYQSSISTTAIRQPHQTARAQVSTTKSFMMKGSQRSPSSSSLSSQDEDEDDNIFAGIQRKKQQEKELKAIERNQKDLDSIIEDEKRTQDIKEININPIVAQTVLKDYAKADTPATPQVQEPVFEELHQKQDEQISRVVSEHSNSSVVIRLCLPSPIQSAFSSKKRDRKSLRKSQELKSEGDEGGAFTRVLRSQSRLQLNKQQQIMMLEEAKATEQSKEEVDCNFEINLSNYEESEEEKEEKPEVLRGHEMEPGVSMTVSEHSSPSLKSQIEHPPSEVVCGDLSPAIYTEKGVLPQVEDKLDSMMDCQVAEMPNEVQDSTHSTDNNKNLMVNAEILWLVEDESSVEEISKSSPPVTSFFQRSLAFQQQQQYFQLKSDQEFSTCHLRPVTTIEIDDDSSIQSVIRSSLKDLTKAAHNIQQEDEEEVKIDESKTFISTKQLSDQIALDFQSLISSRGKSLHHLLNLEKLHSEDVQRHLSSFVKKMRLPVKDAEGGKAAAADQKTRVRLTLGEDLRFKAQVILNFRNWTHRTVIIDKLSDLQQDAPHQKVINSAKSSPLNCSLPQKRQRLLGSSSPSSSQCIEEIIDHPSKMIKRRKLMDDEFSLGQVQSNDNIRILAKPSLVAKPSLLLQ